jgi:hypothetical protein
MSAPPSVLEAKHLARVKERGVLVKQIPCQSPPTPSVPDEQKNPDGSSCSLNV